MDRTLSEKLGLRGNFEAAFDAYNGLRESDDEGCRAVEADRRATVDAVARWLRKHDPSTPGSPHSWDWVAMLLSPSPGGGRPEAP